MKKNILTFLLVCGVLILNAQTGPIAHWDMNGTTNDVTGNGHNGHGNNLTAAAGMDGVMGHAWYFNGTNSSITIPYSPALNVSAYTITATLKVEGFYTGTCHGNTIFMRGGTSGSGDMYFLEFTDYPAGYGCTVAIDTTQESFVPAAFSATGQLNAATFTPFDYTPHIAENTWYTVAATFNDTVFKIYVNNVLKSTVAITTPGVAMGSGTDSASIGYDIYEASAGYPYAFKGVIDDIRLYNRVLTATEITQLYLGVEPIATANSTLSIYPNPAQNELTIISSDKINQITITNLLGQKVYTNEYNTEKVQVDVASLPASVYLIRINGTEVRKFVKQ